MCPSLPAVDVAVVSRSQSAVMHREAELQPSLDPDPYIFPAGVESDLADRSAEADLASLSESSVAAETIPFELVNRTELISLQQSDTSMSSLYEMAEKGDDQYFIESGVLFRARRDKLASPESIHQLVVPASVRPQLLQIADEIPATGHLGVAKTQRRLLRHFVWPDIFRDIKSFCRGCDICQRLGKSKKPVPAPLQGRLLGSKALASVATGNV